MKSFLSGLALASALMAGPAIAQTTLTVYTAFEAEDLQRYKQTFEQAHPDIKINWVARRSMARSASCSPASSSRCRMRWSS